MIRRRDILNGTRMDDFKKKKRRIWRAKILLGIFTIAVLTAGIAYLSGNPKVTISQVSIDGNSAVSSDDILAAVNADLAGHYFHLFSRRNIFLYPRIKIQNDILRNFQRISDVEIRIDNFRSIAVTIKERAAKYIWCAPAPADASGAAAKCYLADQTGYIFDQAADFSGNPYLEFDGGTLPDNPIGSDILPPAEFARIVGFYDGVSDILSPLQFRNITVKNGGEYDLDLAAGGMIIWKSGNDFDKILENLSAAATSAPLDAELKDPAKTLDYIDLRFDDKVYFKFQ